MLVSVDGRRVAILGDMYELGEMTNDAHRQMGEHAVDCGIETILCCGEYSALMEEAAIKAADGYSEDFLIKYYPTLDELLFALPELLDDGDTVLVKASNGMNFKRVVAELIELGGDIIDDEDAELSEDNSVVLELTDEEIASLMLNHDDCGIEHGDD
jgi:UDP-N-acetylmuramyl pentapeptide synthase